MLSGVAVTYFSSWVREMRALIVGFTLTFVILFVALVAGVNEFGQSIVDRFPVIDDVKDQIMPVSRPRAAWSASIVTSHKVREGVPRYIAFYVVGPLKQGVPVIPFKGNPTCEKEDHDEMIVHLVEKTWTSHMCFRIRDFDPTVSYTVVGEAAHSAWPFTGSFFDILVHERLPSFVPRKVERIMPP